MNKKFAKAKRIVEKYKQEHLLQFYNEIEDNQKEELLEQILSTNFNKLNRYYKNSYKDDSIPNNEISPINYYIKSDISKDEKDKYIKIGENLIKERKCCCSYTCRWARNKIRIQRTKRVL